VKFKLDWLFYSQVKDWLDDFLFSVEWRIDRQFQMINTFSSSIAGLTTRLVTSENTGLKISGALTSRLVIADLRGYLFRAYKVESLRLRATDYLRSTFRNKFNWRLDGWALHCAIFIIFRRLLGESTADATHYQSNN